MAEQKVEYLDGENIPHQPRNKWGKPFVRTSPAELDGRKLNPPQTQYDLMYHRFLEQVDAEAFIASGEVPEIVKAMTYVPMTGRGHEGVWQNAPRFVSAAELAGAIDAYFTVIYNAATAGSDVIPDVEMLAAFLGSSRTEMMTWGKKDSEMGRVLDQALNRIAAIKKQLAMHNKIPSLVYLSDMQNNHGYLNQSKQELTIDIRRPIEDRQTLIDNAKLLP